MKRLLSIAVATFAFGQNYVFVHGLKSNADTFFKMAGEFNQSVVKIGIEHYNQNGTCTIPDGDNDKVVNCSEIPSNNTLAKVVYGLNNDFDTKFYFKEFNNTDTNLSMDNAIPYENQTFNSNVFVVNLSNNINLSFEAQGKELKNVIDTIAKATNDNNFVLVGHSMGGIAIRSYLQYFYVGNNNINEIIEIATPNKGVTYDIPTSIYGASAKNLEAGSEDLQKLNSVNLDVYKKIPFIAIVSSGYDKSILSGDLINGSNDDGVVSANSQKPPFDAKIINVTDGIYHTHETSNPKIINLVKKYASNYTNIHSGWNLIGGNVEQFNLKPAKIAWSYDNNWSYYSNEYNLDYPSITQINGGFWIESDKKRDFVLIENNTSTPLHSGWNLVKGEVNMSNVKCNMQIAWKYKNKEWLTYPKIQGYESFDKINKNEGGWIFCKSN